MGSCEFPCCNSIKKKKSNRLDDVNNIKNKRKYSENTIYRITKSLCKISIQSNRDESFGIGFFIYIQLDNKIPCLITNYQNLNKEIIDNKNTVIIQFENQKVIAIKLDSNQRFIKYLSLPTNITIIEILNSDLVSNDIEPLELDYNYLTGYEQYLNKLIYIIHHSINNNQNFTMGEIISIKDFGFEFSINPTNIFSGCPIILIENQKIIGIYENKFGENNFGIFMGEILKKIEKINLDKNLLMHKEESKIVNSSNNYSTINYQNSNSNSIAFYKNQESIVPNEIMLKYKINNDKNIKIFGNEFVTNNKKNFKIFINNQEKEISEHLNIKNIMNLKNSNSLELELKQINPVTNLSYMFSECNNLYSIENLSNLNTSKVTNMNNLFFGCSSLTFISDISNWDISNVKTMTDLFSGCSSLSSLPDISKWDTSNINNISYMFSGCKSLLSLPDISKWETSNITNLSYLFHWCKSLPSLPNISKWNMNNVTDMSWMFSECSSLTNLPNISNWMTNKVTDMNHMFYGCSSLLSLPDISFWDTSNVKDMSYMFAGCSKLDAFPDINNWNINNVKDTTHMFQGCKNKWKIKFRLFN